MLPRELLQRVNRIHIQTQRIVNDILAGEYKSVFKGQGMEFEEVRAYVPGDDIRMIDWNVTARTGMPHVKRFVEERELTVMLVVDMSPSGDFGSVKRTRNEIAAELSALLAFSAIKNNDRVGLIIFSHGVDKFVPPKKGKKHVLRVIREILSFTPSGSGTDIAGAMEYLNKICRRHSVAFLISDFLDTGYERSLLLSSKRHDLVPICIVDPRETELPEVGMVELQDAETGELILIDTCDANTRKAFRALHEKDRSALEEMFKAIDICAVQIRTDQSFVDPLIRFFRERERRK